MKKRVLKAILLATATMHLFGISVQAEEVAVSGSTTCVTEYQDRVLSTASEIPTLNTETDEIKSTDTDDYNNKVTGFYLDSGNNIVCILNGEKYTGTVIMDGDQYYFNNGRIYTGFVDDESDPYVIYPNPDPENFRGVLGKRFYYKGKPGNGIYTCSAYYDIWTDQDLTWDEMYDYVKSKCRHAEERRMNLHYYYFEDGYGIFGLREGENGARIYLDGWHFEHLSRYGDRTYWQVRQELAAQGVLDINASYQYGQLFSGWSYEQYYQDGYLFTGDYYETGEMNLFSPSLGGQKPEFLETGKTYFMQEGEIVEGWYEADGRSYWYEHGIRQGYDSEDTTYRGKEIYDPESDAWYWLDNVQQGGKAVSKDVYQESYAGAFADREDGTGKWVRYDAEGHMIKGWSMTDAGTYYFDPETGAMAKGHATIDGTECYFDPATGILQEADRGLHCVWVTIDGKEYWYENGVRQGYEPDDPSYRGKEIYDPVSGAWYWLDNIQQGAKAVSKYVYQESYAGQYADREDGTGKWVLYDENGHMVKGWYKERHTRQQYYEIVRGQTVHCFDCSQYFDLETGAMVKGNVDLNGYEYAFDITTGWKHDYGCPGRDSEPYYVRVNEETVVTENTIITEVVVQGE